MFVAAGLLRFIVPNFRTNIRKQYKLEGRFRFVHTKLCETASTEILGRSRILVGFMQIMNGLVSGFDIPWPPMFLSIIGSLSLINFDFVRLLGGLDVSFVYVSLYLCKRSNKLKTLTC